MNNKIDQETFKNDIAHVLKTLSTLRDEKEELKMASEKQQGSNINLG